MTCRRDYIETQPAAVNLPAVPTNPDDWNGVRNLLQALRDALTKATATHNNTVLQNQQSGVPASDVLPAPTGFSVVATTAVALLWEPYEDPYIENFSYYRVYRSLVNNFETASIVAAISATRFVDNDILVTGTYYYWVSGVTKLGREGIIGGAVFITYNGVSSDITPGTIDTSLLADLAVTEAKVANLAITETKIDDDSISTPKLQANSVVAAKIDVAQLSAISADLGTITAGTVTGALIRTATSGARIELDSSNGFQSKNSGGTTVVQVPISGGIFATNYNSLQFPTDGYSFTGHTSDLGLNGGSVFHATASLFQISSGVALDLATHAAAFFPRYVAQSLGGGTTEPTMQTNELMVVKDTDTGLFYVLFYDGSTYHSAQLI